ncbi:MAG: peptidylprolyl isomerase [Clostridia bacterium]|nr:peptidylprolyl isomerase [Clostridia bacterium]
MAKKEMSSAEAYRQERKERLAKAAKQNQKKSHNIILTKGTKTAIAVVVVIALVAGIAGFAVSNSGVLERGKVAFKVGETEVTMAEYSYYYNSVFNNYFQYSHYYDSNYGQGMGKMYTGYDYSVAPDQQSYPGEIEGIENPTFTDFFDHSARESIKLVKASKAYAAENNITLDDEDYKKIDEALETFEQSASKSGNYSLPAYLRMSYGKAMTTSLLEEICEEQVLNEKVQEVKMAEYTDSYSDKKIEKEFADNPELYGAVSLRNYVIKAETVTVKAEEEGEEDTEEVTKETMAAAKTKAETFVSRVNGGEDFKAVASSFEKLAGSEKYAELKNDDSLTLMEDITYSDLSYSSADEKFLDWALDEKTAEGETYITENEGEGYTVYMMVDPVHHIPDVKTYDVRHILLQFPKEETKAETEEAAEGEDASEETTEAAEEKKEDVEVELLNPADYDVTVDIDVDLETTKDKALYKEAQDILAGYLAGDKTEDAFAELAKKHSSDGNAEQGGIYEDVPQGQMVPEFENWSLAEGRKAGDVGIVETTYGYHIMYAVDAPEVTTWSDTIKNDLASAEYNTFAEEIIKADNVAITDEQTENLAAVKDFTVSLAKQQIRNIQANASAAAY